MQEAASWGKIAEEEFKNAVSIYIDKDDIIFSEIDDEEEEAKEALLEDENDEEAKEKLK